MTRILVAMPEKCTGCGLCRPACAAAHGDAFPPDQALLGVETFPALNRSVPSVCFQCANPDCMAACPEHAISHDESGTVQVHAERCTGCGACAQSCPWGQISLGGDGTALKCDLCGGEPACVQACVPGPLVFAEPDRDLRRLRGTQMLNSCPEGSPAGKRRKIAKRFLNTEDDT